MTRMFSDAELPRQSTIGAMSQQYMSFSWDAPEGADDWLTHYTLPDAWDNFYYGDDSGAFFDAGDWYDDDWYDADWNDDWYDDGTDQSTASTSAPATASQPAEALWGKGSKPKDGCSTCGSKWHSTDNSFKQW